MRKAMFEMDPDSENQGPMYFVSVCAHTLGGIGASFPLFMLFFPGSNGGFVGLVVAFFLADMTNLHGRVFIFTHMSED